MELLSSSDEVAELTEVNKSQAERLEEMELQMDFLQADADARAEESAITEQTLQEKLTLSEAMGEELRAEAAALQCKLESSEAKVKKLQRALGMHQQQHEQGQEERDFLVAESQAARWVFSFYPVKCSYNFNHDIPLSIV